MPRPKRNVKPANFEYFELADIKEEPMHVEAIQDDEGSSCRLCCDSRNLTNSVHDDVIIDFFNAVPSLSLDDELSSTRVCQKCFRNAKTCVDFIRKIQTANKTSGPVISSPAKPSTTAEGTFFKLKRIGNIDIKKVKTVQQHPAKRKVVEPDDDYQPDSCFESKPPKRSKKSKSPVVDSDDDSQDSDEAESEAFFISAPIKFTCFKCRGSFRNAKELLTHTKNCTQRLKCHLCRRIFTAITGLEAHLANHPPNKSSVFCDQCGKEFKDSFMLESHIEATHVRVVRPDCVFRCSKCLIVLDSQLDLLNHAKQHNKEIFDEPEICKVCSREFYDRTSFSRHVHRPKEVICDLCGRAFLHRGDLREHMHLHTGIKEFPCDLCDKIYARQAARVRHRRRAHPRATPLLGPKPRKANQSWVPKK